LVSSPLGQSRLASQGFEFLGYRFEAGRRWVRDKMIRGWFGYFKHAYKSTFQSLDGFIRRRRRSILRKQEKRPGFGKCHADHRRWPNVYFAALGLFTMAEARMSASQSR
jgi:RNA-directed DNA polymerase